MGFGVSYTQKNHVALIPLNILQIFHEKWYLTKNGVMKADILYEPPYTNFNSDGLSGVFSIDDSHQIVAILNSIQENAAA